MARAHFSEAGFVELIGAIRDAGYDFRSFDDFDAEYSIVLRHDVDFSPADAAKMAALEQQLGVTATYFILLTSAFYNPLAPDTKASVDDILAGGARLGLHFDASVYEDLDEGFERERRIFEEGFGRPLEIVSLHRPRGFLDDNNRKLPGVRHTYEDAFFRDLKYIADSGGSFAYGDPLDSEVFAQRKSIHLNLHPIWWMRDGDSPSEKLRSWQRDHLGHIAGETARNCRTYDGLVTVP